MTTKDVDRREGLARALARIITADDLLDIEQPPIMAEAIESARQALAARDDDYRRCMIVIGETHAEAVDWAERNEIDGGAGCFPVTDPRDLVSYKPPFTVVVLPGAENTDQWPRVWARVAALGEKVDVIRIGRRPAADLKALGNA